jgi:ADP-heptose:LPS heptosyltransferase
MKKLLKFCFYLAALITDCYIKVAIKSGHGQKRKKTVCLVKADGIGDTLVWFSAFQALYLYYKNMGYDIILICAAPCKAFYEESFEFLDLIEIDIRRFYRFGYRCEFLKKIRRLPADLLINCAYSRTISIDSIARISSAGRKLGNFGDTVNTPGFIKGLTDRIYTELAPPAKEINEMSRNRNLLQWLGETDYRENTAQLPDSFSADRIIEGDYFVVFPGASLLNRCWPEERFAECGSMILEKRNWKLVICGGKAEKIISRNLVNLIKEKDRIVDLTGKTSIKELSSVISHSKFVLTNDTSAVHFAMAWKIPNLCISKGCDIGRFIPYHSDVVIKNNIIHKVVYSSDESCSPRVKAKCNSSQEVFSCINKITAESVITEINSILEKIGV